MLGSASQTPVWMHCNTPDLGVMRLYKEKIHLHLPIESKFLDLEILKISRTYKPKTFLYEFKLKGHAFFLKM